MSEIEREQVRHVARLARLELAEEEIDGLAEDLERVLSRFRELEAAEDREEEGGEAGEGAGAGPSGDGSGLRPDRPDPDPLARPPGELAPAWRDGFFLVPRLEAVAGEGGSGESGGAGG